MRAKLVSARFRHLNETLYTRPSADALQLFTESPEMFSEYHEGFRRQVDVWPENPVDGYIRDIKARGKVKPPSRDPRKQHKQVQETDQIVSLPRTDDTATIADMGCGDARLAEVLTPLAKKLKLSLHSFDLHSPSPLVTRADIANVPLADGAADVVIFCLALMGTNWIDFIEEAYRILRWKGELWIAEIKSRFAGKAALTAAAGSGGRVVEHSVGNRKKQQAVGKKPAKPTAAEVAAEGEDLAIEVDGADDRRNETDLSAFVEALRKRGFVLQAEDMSNRMFVRMLFVKSAPPTKGKGVEAAKAREAAKMAAMGGDRNKKQKRFVWEDKDKEEEEGVDETAILKPCVYKLR
ncbi:methyltransferase-domain-containing protein [Plectosphaerella plurivora]|uniref:Ribosomal RNA-processing protein 8 n=1 Tax=Plectosphaerella plurivora TaxID=936078 RepID=A0A9P9ADV4_9PEZI|nr:methyltransferase-domain-containing protein [Plectosphaerella plurivora]